MADDATKQAAQTALGGLTVTTLVGIIGTWIVGIFNGANRQNSDLNKRLVEENARLLKELDRLRRQASLTLEWKSLCLDARRSARDAGYRDPWPDDPEDGDV